MRNLQSKPSVRSGGLKIVSAEHVDGRSASPGLHLPTPFAPQACMVTRLAAEMDTQQHWEAVYGSKASDEVSWFRPHLETSLALIEHASEGNRSAAILDAGGGASTLVDDLIDRGYSNITVLDISQAALDATRQRLGKSAEDVHWLRADVTQASLPAQAFDVWHDRAVFHFLTAPEARIAYVRNVAAALKPGGHMILGTFALEGPRKCSGLDVVRYDAESLHRELGSQFKLLESSTETHETPFGTKQQFLYCHFKLEQ
jgi:2-polyprenyl-3-methyl-5-hydroxy-6-metoxy-1,4-benzoquinol methylase